MTAVHLRGFFRPIVVGAALLAFALPGWAANAPWVSSEPVADGVALVDGVGAAPIVVSAADHEVVSIAVNDLASDIERVTGHRPHVLSVSQKLPGHAVIVGTLGRGGLVDQLVVAGKLDASALQGKWETFVITTIDAPLPGIERALVIAGSDRRGTAFGVYELSQAIGVSPWHWWADVPPLHTEQLHIAAGTRVFGPPSVKYRGIFINDEDWGLQPWAAKTFAPEEGDIGPTVYRRVFELLLRLKANTLWPAMHACTRPFNAFPENAALADTCAIVMGSSHAEPMLRNNVGEWTAPHEDYNYVANRDGVLGYWDERVRSNGRFENLYTLGMRGIHDSNMVGPRNDAERIATLERIFADQRGLLARHVRPEVEQVPQIFCAYKEVLDLYRQGLRVPDDVTIVWPDDNFGYIRNFASPAERSRSGGFGVYYHISYLGRPLAYLWLCTTPPALIWEEMSRAYEHGADRVWIVNVGDIKPAEIGTEFFLQMAWNIDRWKRDNLSQFLVEWATREFGREHAPVIADVMSRYYALNFVRKPEHLQWWLPRETPRPSDWSAQEWEERLAAFRRLVMDVERLAAAISPAAHEAFFELVEYPVRGAALANERYFHGEAGDQQSIARARAAHAELEDLTRRFNDEAADGKWKHLMALEPADDQWRSMRIAKWEPLAAPAAKEATAGRIDTRLLRSTPGRNGAEWKPIPGLGRSGAALAVFPSTATPVALEHAAAEAPQVEYAFDTQREGVHELEIELLPTHPLAGTQLRLAIALDDDAPRLLALDVNDGGPEWAQGVLNNSRVLRTALRLTRPGLHRLRLFGLEAGVIVDRLALRHPSGPGSARVSRAVSGVSPDTRESIDLDRPTLSLAGSWRFALDRDDRGITESWFSHELPDRIELPGVLQAQGYGDPISKDTPWVLSLYDRQWHERAPYRRYASGDDVKVPFLSQPPRHYLGAGWYQRDFTVPPEWTGRRIVLTLERARWETTVWVDAHRIGSDRSLVAPHVYDLGVLEPGQHTVSVRVDNRMLLPYRPDAHAVSDSLGSTWNGIVGRIEIAATTPVWLDDVQVFPDVARREARVRVEIGNATGRSGAGTLSAGGATQPVRWTEVGAEAELTVALGSDAKLWSEFDPALQRLEVRLAGDNAGDTRTVTFGLRELRTAGTQFVLNNRPVHMRGTHHGGDFPLTGFPPTNVDYWRKLFRTCRAWGLNHMRFHSWCPPEAAFVAADEIGFYLQPECGMWNVISPGTEMERVMYAETERMLRAYGNHPSFILMSPSNEPGGRWKESLPPWVAHFRKVDSRRLYTTGTGWSLIDTPGPLNGAVDYLAVHRIGRNLMRGVPAWFGRDYSASMAGVDVPNLVHELGQWCAYPDFDLIDKFTGYLRPGNYQIFRDLAAAKDLLARNDDFARASGRFQLLCYKEEIEANLRTKELGGFQLLDLHDYLGQGTALVGLLDAFWEEKSHATAAEFRRFCGPTVPLARLTQRVFTTADRFAVDVEIAHYGEHELADARPYWRVLDAVGAEVAAGEWRAREISFGGGTSLGRVELDLATLSAPAAYRLVVGLRDQPVENDWRFWVYPAEAPSQTPGEIVVTHSWPEAERQLAAGARVLYLPRPAELNWNSPPLANVPVFWNRLMGPAWSRMLGLWCDTEHPALARFPTEAHCDWQWAEIIDEVRAFNLDGFPTSLRPIVEAIDDWNRAYKLGVVFECRVGRGRLLVSCVDLERDLERRPVARQLRDSLHSYMRSEAFAPGVVVEPATIRAGLFETRVMARLGATVEGAGRDHAALIDGDPNTFWMAGAARRGRPEEPRAGAGQDAHPYSVTVVFPEAVEVSGVRIMPRQNHREHQGDVREFAIESSKDGTTWTAVARGTLESSFEPSDIMFPGATSARRLRFSAFSGFGDDRTAALAELAVITPDLHLDGGDGNVIRYQRVPSATAEIDDGGARQ